MLSDRRSFVEYQSRIESLIENGSLRRMKLDSICNAIESRFLRSGFIARFCRCTWVLIMQGRGLEIECYAIFRLQFELDAANRQVRV